MKHTVSKSPPANAKHLTLLLQCHGEIQRGRVVSSSNVKVYSLVGAPGMRAEIGKSLNPEDKGQSSDFLLGTVIHDVYRYEFHKNPGISHTDLLESLTDPLKQLYSECDITYPRGFEIHDNPKEYRTFYFHPGEHESCRSCIRTGSRRCTYPRTFGTRTTEDDIVWCPEYGIFPVISSDEHDYTHTIVSIGEKDRIGAKRTLSHRESNIPSDTVFIEPKNIIGNAGRDYWRNKIVRNPDLLPPLQEKLLTDFDTLCLTQKITIDHLINLFQLGMGYTHLYIIDPSCRSYINARGEAITDEQLRASARTRWHHAIDSTLQTLSRQRSRSRSATGETITPTCVYTRRQRVRHGPKGRDTKSRGSCVMMGGGRTQQMRGRRRRCHTRERRRRKS
jgi:hypothetical protein